MCIVCDCVRSFVSSLLLLRQKETNLRPAKEWPRDFCLCIRRTTDSFLADGIFLLSICSFFLILLLIGETKSKKSRDKTEIMAVGRGWNDIKQKRGLCGTSFTLDHKAPAPRWRNHSFQITWPTQEFLQGTQSEWKMDSETGQYGDYRESCSLIGGNILLKSAHFLCYNQFKNQNLWRNVFLYLAGPF